MKLSEARDKLNVGDWVKTNGSNFGTYFEGEIGEIDIKKNKFYVFQNSKDGSEGTISPSTKGYKYSWVINFDESGEIEIIKSSKSKLMNLKEKFINLFVTEPTKSFRKAGILNGDNLITDDGEKIFLTWLLKQNQDKFKTEVVDPILDEEEPEKK